jgi:hypothetical protein
VPDSLLPEQGPANRYATRLTGMEPDAEQVVVTRFEEPGNANLEPVPPLVPDRLIAEYVARQEAAAQKPD